MDSVMKLLKPTSISQIIFNYSCPSCGISYIFDNNELTLPSCYFRCSCGQVMKLAPMSNITVSPVYREGKTKPIYNKKEKKIISILKRQNYSVKEIKEMLGKVKISPDSNVNDILKEVLGNVV